MKDTLITAHRKKTELIWLAISLLIAVLLNIYAISHFKTLWKELYTQIPTVLILGIIINVVTGIVRLGIRGILTMMRNKPGTH